jgi:Flp pilus assembly protein TadD
MSSSGASILASTLTVLLAGCAGTADQGHMVVGSGSAQDRHDIDASNQQMTQIEQAGIPVTSGSAPAAAAPSSSTPDSAAPPNPPSTPAEPPPETP